MIHQLDLTNQDYSSAYIWIKLLEQKPTGSKFIEV
jgi:hypothetical protein